MMKRIFSAIAALCLLLLALSVSVFAESTESTEAAKVAGSTDVPIIIPPDIAPEPEHGSYWGLEVLYVNDEADLLPGSELRDKISTAPYEVRLTRDMVFTPEQSAQMRSIYLADGTWFDGCGYMISGWNYTGTADWEFFGVFRGTGKEGLMQYVKICNLSIIDCTFTFTEASANGTTGIVCPLVGYGCEFANIYTNAIVHAYGNARACSVFGVLANGAAAVVEYCQFDGEINSANIAPAFFRGVWADDSLTMHGCLMTGLLVAKGQQVERGVFVAQMQSTVTFKMSECHTVYGSVVPLWGSAGNIEGDYNMTIPREEMNGVGFLDRMRLDLSMYGPTVDQPPVLRIAAGKGTVREVDDYLDYLAINHIPHVDQEEQSATAPGISFGDSTLPALKKTVGVLAVAVVIVAVITACTPKKAYRRKR